MGKMKDVAIRIEELEGVLVELKGKLKTAQDQVWCIHDCCGQEVCDCENELCENELLLCDNCLRLLVGHHPPAGSLDGILYDSVRMIERILGPA